MRPFKSSSLLSVISTCALCLATLTVAPTQAWAQDGEMTQEEKETRASEYALEARDYFRDGDYARAIELLQLANMLIQDARVLLNIGSSYEKMGDCVNAMAYYDAALRVDPPSPDWQQKPKDKLNALAPDCPDYDPSGRTGRISLDSFPRGATVKIDGKVKGKTPFEVILLPDGRHTFEVSKDNFKTISEKVVLSEKADLRLDYKLEAIPEDGGPDPFDGKDDGDITEPLEVSEDPGLNIPAIAMVGAGAVGLGVGAYINWVQLCDTCFYATERAKFAPDSQEFQDLTAERQNRVVIMAASTTVGALLVAGGTTWFLLDRKKQQEGEEQSLIIAPSVSPDGAGVGMHWRF